MASIITETTICNSALIKVGADRIINLQEDNKRAILCNERYKHIRDELLEIHPWRFALKRVELAQTTATPEFDFDNEYLLPNDFLKVHRLDDDLIIFSIEQDKLYSNSDTIKMLYIFRQTNTSMYTPLFAEALAWRLAADIAYPLIQSVSLSEKILKVSEIFLAKARTSSAQGRGTPQDSGVDAWTNSRL